MPLTLPPWRSIKCDPTTAQLVDTQLTSLIAGHPQATTPYRFYEKLDSWLGPWGARGYPLAYGKFYCIAFHENAKLMANSATAEWVRRTTSRLQEALRDYIVARIRNCTVATLTESELRQAAFDTHPRAYDAGGLATVALVAPELIPLIAVIPRREFNPASQNFEPTVLQVLRTMGRVAPQVSGGVLAALAGPAHTGLFRIAADRDRRLLSDEATIGRELHDINTAINNGKFDHVPFLDLVIERLNETEFPNQSLAQFARLVTMNAEQRRRSLRRRYGELLDKSPMVRDSVRHAFPRLLQ